MSASSGVRGNEPTIYFVNWSNIKNLAFELAWNIKISATLDVRKKRNGLGQDQMTIWGEKCIFKLYSIAMYNFYS